MRAVVFDQFGTPPQVRDVPDPSCPPDGVLVQVAATGLCRSDWHGWQGHDPDIRLPHVPGHEFAGTVVEVGPRVRRTRPGDRVTAPFVQACGRCRTCARGDQQVCENQRQPGFTGWGSFARYVTVDVADVNVVALPDAIDHAAAASLGCRFATAYRALVGRGGVRPDEWVAVHGCGGVGLSAVLIAVASGARVVAIDPTPQARARAVGLGARAALDPAGDDVPVAVEELTGGGADLSVDAIGGAVSLSASIACLRPRGRHVQVGLMGADAAVPAAVLSRVVARELDLLGSHGMAAHDYPAMLARVAAGELDVGRLVRRTVGLAEGARELTALGAATVDGITLIDPSLD